MADDLLNVLTRFHREMVVPDMRAIVSEEVGALRNDMLNHVDGIYQHLRRLELESQALKGGLQRVEERLTALEERVGRLEDRVTVIEQKLDRLALRSEVDELKSQVAVINARIAELEAQITRA